MFLEIPIFMKLRNSGNRRNLVRSKKYYTEYYGAKIFYDE